jgi:uroporphyrinogen-III synthase
LPPPLSLLLTRPPDQSRAFAAALESAAPGRFEAILAPVLKITPVDTPLDLRGIEALLFTSANGVEAFAARDEATDARALPAFCVGAMTTEAARKAGFSARSADGDVQALARLAASAHCGGVFLHVRGHHAAGSLTGLLEGMGIPACAAEIYQQQPVPIGGEARKMLASGDINIVASFSPRSARLFANQARAESWKLDSTISLALSPAADGALGTLELATKLIAERPDRPGMVSMLTNL